MRVHVFRVLEIFIIKLIAKPGKPALILIYFQWTIICNLTIQSQIELPTTNQQWVINVPAHNPVFLRQRVLSKLHIVL